MDAAPPDRADQNADDRNLFSAEAAADPQRVYEALRASPVSKMELQESSFLVSRHEDVIYALRHPEIFSSAIDAVMIGQDRPLIPLQVDPPDHAKYRRLLDPHFAPREVIGLEADARKLVNELIDNFVDKGTCNFHREFSVPLPCTIFLRLMGLPLEHLDRFLEWKDGIIRPDVDPGDAEAAERARTESGAEIYAYFENAIDERGNGARDDLLSQLLVSEVDGRRLTRNEILDICYLFLLGGLDTVTATLDCAVAYLARHPEQRRRLVEDPELTAPAIEELLRSETPVAVVLRVVKERAELHGVELRPGDHVTLVLGAADRDPAEFPDAETVDFDRGANRHLAFGGGPHRCLGSHLARLELRVALEELHRRIPDYSVAPDVELEYTPGIREIGHLPLVFETAPA